MTHHHTSLFNLERATRAFPPSNETSTAYVKWAKHGFVNHKLGLRLHDPVKVSCQLCEGRGHYVDIIERDGSRIVTRHACPACKGKGWIDISRGPVTDDPAMGAICTKVLHTFVPCENCGGEGGFPEPHGEWGICPACEGTGELPSGEHELIDLTDLDRVFGADPDACPEGADNPVRGRD